MSSISNVCMCPQFGCCGGVTYTDWSQNMYFNCNTDNPSRERCSVPFSCCLISQDKVASFNRLYWKILFFYVYLNLHSSLCTDGYQHYVWPRHAGFKLCWRWKPHLHKRLHRQTGQLDSQQPVLHWRYCIGNGCTTGRLCSVPSIPASTLQSHVVSWLYLCPVLSSTAGWHLSVSDPDQSDQGPDWAPEL